MSYTNNEVPIGWELRKIKSLGKFQNGFGFPERFQGNTDEEIPFLKVSDINNPFEVYVDSASNYVSTKLSSTMNWSLTPIGSIIFPKIGVALLKNHRKINVKEVIIDNNMSAFVKRENINNKYLFYIFKELDMQNFVNISAVPSINFDLLKNFQIPITSDLKLQKQIANYLDKKTAKIDATIAKNEELIQLLEEKRVALINQVVTKGLNPDVPMKDSGVEWIGEIPEHWDITKVKHELDFLDHKRIPLSAEVRSDMDRIYDYYGASGVIDKVDSYLFNGKYILVGEDGANLLSRSTPLAFIAEGKFWVNNHAHILDPKYGNNIDYFVSLLEAVDYTPFIEGSAQPKLTADNLKNVILIKPPLVEQNEIATFLNLELNHINNTLSKIQENINLLDEYKTSLIHHVVTGKIDVRGEEI